MSIYRSAAGAAAVERRYRDILGRWPVPSEQLRLSTREGETFVVVCGPEDAPPLVLLQGTGANAAMWLADVADWAKEFRVYAVDLPGEPGLSAPSRPALASDAYSLWLEEVLDALEVAKASLVGVSLGGWLALDLATRRPDRVRRLVLISPSGLGRQRLSGLIAAMLYLPFGDWGRRRMIARVVGATAAAGSTPYDTDLRDLALLISAHFRYRVETVPRVPPVRLQRLSMPVLLLVGGRDIMLDSRKSARLVEQFVPNATVRLLPDEGHVLTGQAATIADHLRGGR
jgi:pimeloyl-ACP methyl ester carboxylesterase